MADMTPAVEAAARSIYESLTPPEANPEWEQVPPFIQHVFGETALAALEAAKPHQKVGPMPKKIEVTTDHRLLIDDVEFPYYLSGEGPVFTTDAGQIIGTLTLHVLFETDVAQVITPPAATDVG